MVPALCFGLFWSAAAPGAGLQLPPHVLLDQLLLRTERLIEADDLDATVEAMEEAFALAAEHELELPPDFRFEQGRTEFAVGLLGTAKESVTEYLAVVNREAESYLDAVGLLEDVDRILERRDAPECSPLPEGPACWMELTSHPGCFVWNRVPQATETATWTGECPAGFAHGPGTLSWTYRDGEQEEEGNLRYGRSHGECVIRDTAGWVSEGPYRFGKERGHWVVRFVDGGVQEGPYVDGERHGHWVLRFASGAVHEGPMMNGERNGHWVTKDADGDVGEGPYEDGEKNGHWVERFAGGNVAEGRYVDGKRQGDWVWNYPDGQVESGPYVDGKQHGRWRVAFPDGEVTYVEFVHGVRQEP